MPSPLAPEKTWVPIGGVEQGLIIEGRDARSPVLLYLHGGMPDYFLTRRYPTGLGELFTVVWWEQRGSGLSYRSDLDMGTVTPERLIADALELTDHLRERFCQDRVYLMGHSGGTLLGLQLAARAPERFHAYVAVAQMTDQLASERLAHAFMLRRFQEIGDRRMAARLDRAPVGRGVPLSRAYLRVRDVAMHRLGVGTTRDARSLVRDLVLPSLLHPGYTPAERVRLWRGKVASGHALWNTQLSTDLTALVPRLDVPAYFLHGAHDYTVSYPLARAYVERLEAPVKGFYTFRHSAHSPHFEEPERTREILRTDVLTGTTGLADPA